MLYGRSGSAALLEHPGHDGDVRCARRARRGGSRTARPAARRTARAREPGSPKSRANASGRTHQVGSGGEGRRSGRAPPVGSRVERRRRAARPPPAARARGVVGSGRHASQPAMRHVGQWQTRAVVTPGVRSRRPRPGAGRAPRTAPTRPPSSSVTGPCSSTSSPRSPTSTEVVVVGDEVPTTRPVTFTREDPTGGGPAAGAARRPRSVRAASRPSWSCSPSTCPWSPRDIVGGSSSPSEYDGAALVDPSGRVQYLCAAYRWPRSTGPGPVVEDEHGLSMRRPGLAASGLSRSPTSGDETRDLDTWDDLVELRARLGERGRAGPES